MKGHPGHSVQCADQQACYDVINMGVDKGSRERIRSLCPGGNRVLDAVGVLGGCDDAGAADAELVRDADVRETVDADARRRRVDVRDLRLAGCGVQAVLHVVLEEAVEASTW